MAEPAESEPAPSASTPSVPRWRRFLVGALVVLACILAPISVMGVWINNTLLNTDHYVSTVGPLASNSAVQNALANRITNELVQNSGVQQRIKTALPPKASFIAPYISNGLNTFVHGLSLRVVQSSQFETLWKTVNRRAHSQVVALLKGQGKRLNFKNGDVIVNLNPVVDAANKKLESLGINSLSSKASGGNNQLVLFSSSDLTKVQGAVRLLNNLAIVLPILTALLFAAAIVLSPKRRRTILRSALGLGLAMALMLIVFNLLRAIYVNGLPAGVDTAAAKAVYDQLLSFLRLSLRSLFVLAVIVALGAWLAGPGRLATRIRTGSRDVVRRAPGETSVAPSVAAFVDRRRTALRIAVVAVGLVILIALSAPGPLAILIVALLVLLGLAVIELLGRGASQPSKVDA